MRRLLKSEFVRNIASLASGTVLAQLIGVACIPIITRLFDPQEYGVLSLFISVTSFMSAISMLRYEVAIVIPKSDRHSLDIIGLCAVLLLSVSLLSLLFIIIISCIYPSFDVYVRLGNWSYCIPLLIFIQGLRMIMNSWNIRKKSFTVASIGNVMRIVINNLTSVGVAKFGLISNGGLIVGTLAGQFIETTYLSIYNRRVVTLAIRNIRLDRLKSVFHRHINFFKINTPHILVDSLRNYLSPIVISYFFSEQILGYYSLMLAVIMLPVSFIGSAISQVFYVKLAHKFSHKQDIYRLTLKIVAINAVIPIIPSVLIFFWGEELFSFVLGSKWSEAGDFASRLALYMYIYFVSTCTAFIPYVIDKMKMSFYYSVLTNTSFFLIIYLGALKGMEFKYILDMLNIIVPATVLAFIIHIIIEIKRVNEKNN